MSENKEKYKKRIEITSIEDIFKIVKDIINKEKGEDSEGIQDG